LTELRPPPAERPQLRARCVYLDATSSTAHPDVVDHDDSCVVDLDDFLGLPVQKVDRLQKRRPERSNLLGAVDALFGTDRVRPVHFEIVGDRVQRAVRVSPVHRGKYLADDLNVFLRHRARSIARRGPRERLPDRGQVMSLSPYEVIPADSDMTARAVVNWNGMAR
jgi:hypothetical protein